MHHVDVRADRSRLLGPVVLSRNYEYLSERKLLCDP